MIIILKHNKNYFFFVHIDIPKVRLHGQGMFPGFLLGPQVSSFRVLVAVAVAAPEFRFPSAMHVFRILLLLLLYYHIITTAKE